MPDVQVLEVNLNVGEGSGYYDYLKGIQQKREEAKAIKDAEREQKKNEYLRERRIQKTSTSLLSGGLYANAKLGQYTGNTHTASNISNSIGLVAGAITSPGLTALAISKKALDLVVGNINANQSANYNQQLSGRPSISGSRWRGKNV